MAPCPGEREYLKMSGEEAEGKEQTGLVVVGEWRMGRQKSLEERGDRQIEGGCLENVGGGRWGWWNHLYVLPSVPVNSSGKAMVGPI